MTTPSGATAVPSGSAAASSARAGSLVAGPAHTHAQAPIPADPAAIQAAIVERQQRLAVTIDELTHRVSPKELARRGAATAQARARAAVMTPTGDLRTERVGAIGAAVALVLALMIWSRRRR